MNTGHNTDSEESGCLGLRDGWAYKKENGKKVHATQVRKKDGPFICRACLSDAVHRHCIEKKDHFAHHATTTSIVGAGETEIHKQSKNAIFKELSTRFSEFKWICDNTRIPENKEFGIPALQPDIGGSIGGKRVAIEVQNSSLSIPKIIKRSSAYSKRGISILWVLPLKRQIDEDLFRPRLFERYLHSIYFGRVYYWFPDYGSNVLPVHFSIAYKHIPYGEWYEDDGEHREVGGYDKPYKRIRHPVKWKPISISDHFYHFRRPEHRPWNELKTVPEMKIFMDKLPIWWDKNEDELLDRYYPDELD